MDSVLGLLALLYFLGDSAPAKKTPPPPLEKCEDGAPLVYDGPKVYGDLRKSDVAAGLTPGERTHLSNILDDVDSEDGLLTIACTQEGLREVMGWPSMEWSSLLGALVWAASTGVQVPRWAAMSAAQKTRVGVLALAVQRHQAPASETDLEDEAAENDPPQVPVPLPVPPAVAGPRGSVSESAAVSWVLARRPKEAPANWSVPIIHQVQKPGQTTGEYLTNLAFYYAYATAPFKIVVPQHNAWVPVWNRMNAAVNAGL